MFIKRLLCLLLCASLFAGLVPAACAEAVYQPGEISGRLISDALRSGDMLCADIELDLALRPQALGVAEEDAALVEMICTHLKDAVLTLGAARIPGGAALLLRAEYGEPGVSADVTLGLTGEGASLETTLLPGERLWISWEDALTLAGLDDADRAAVLSLRSVDPAQAMQLIVQTFELGKTTVSMASAPYVQIVRDFIAAQPVETQYNIAPEALFPAAASETTLIITQKALGSLLTSLCAQLERDFLLRTMLDSALESAAGMDTAALCAAVREAAAVLTDEEYPFCFVTGYDAAQQPIYYSLCTSDASGVSYALNLIAMQDSTDGRSGVIQAFMADAQNYTGLAVSLFSDVDPDDPNTQTLGLGAECHLANELVFSGEYITATQPAPDESGRACYDSMAEYAFDVLIEGSVLSLSGSSQSKRGQTDGGEYAEHTSTAQSHLGDVLLMQTTSQSSGSIAQTEGGVIGAYSAQYASPQQGVDNADISARLYTLPYAPAEAAVLDLGSATEESMNALMQRLQTQAEALISALSSQLAGTQPAAPESVSM